MGDRGNSGAGMAGNEQEQRRNLPPLRLHVPEPRFRPGDVADFSDLEGTRRRCMIWPMGWSACWTRKDRR
jgi:hypothetical protein